MLHLTPDVLKKMADVDIRTVDIDTLTELSDIKIDTSRPVDQKLNMLASQTNNIYVTRCGEYVVKVVHQKDGPTIDERMEEYLQYMMESCLG